MNTQNNLNLDVNYLEVVTCTYNELCNIKKPVNGRLYHTSDTNEFFFDWNNKRHKMSVFTTDYNVSDENLITKTELTNWLNENDYVTNVSLVDELVRIIGSPLENIITLNALEDYANEHLLTKSELGLLDNPMQFAEDVRTLKAANENFWNTMSSLANTVDEVRTIANEKITSGELNTVLNDYLSKEEIENIYLSKDEAGNVYVDNEKLANIIRDYVTKENLQSNYHSKNEALETFAKKTDLNNYETKQSLQEQYLKKNDANVIFATKTDLESYDTKEDVNSKLGNYVKKSEANAFATKTEVESNYVKKSKLSEYSKNSDLETFAKKIWVNEYFLKKTETSNFVNKTYFNEKIRDYVTKEYVNGKLENYLTAEQISNSYLQKNSLAGYLKMSDISEELSSFAKKIWVDEYYMRKFNLSDYMKSDEINRIFLKKTDAQNIYLSKTEAEDTYAKKTDIVNQTGDYIERDDLEPFAKKLWVDEYYMRKFEFEGFKNALILSTEYHTRTDFNNYYNTTKPQQGFYYLTNGGEDENTAEMWVIINNDDLKAKANLTAGTMEIKMKLDFEGPAALQW